MVKHAGMICFCRNSTSGVSAMEEEVQEMCGVLTRGNQILFSLMLGYNAATRQVPSSYMNEDLLLLYRKCG